MASASLPIHVARAYGAAPLARIAPAREPAAPPKPTLKSIVAALVERPVDFEPAGRPSPAPAAVSRLYTRTADTVEAAVAVNVGASIDVKA